MSLKYKRVLLKISGEILKGTDGSTVDYSKLKSLCDEISTCVKEGIQVAVVIGAGNIYRGHTYNGRHLDFERVDADKMGMIATIINALALQSYFERQGFSTLLQSSFDVEGICSRFSKSDSLKAMNEGSIIIFCGGTGNPFFSTDSAAALRACELGVDILLKATNVDGIYDSDPHQNPDAKKFEKISYSEVLNKKIQVMDLTALVLCMENGIPLRVFDVNQKGNIEKAIHGEFLGTFVGNLNYDRK